MRKCVQSLVENLQDYQNGKVERGGCGKILNHFLLNFQARGSDAIPYFHIKL